MGNFVELFSARSPRQQQYVADLPANFELTREFENVLAQIEDGPQCVFVTGKAGTGKSTLLRYLLATTTQQVAVLAPTGLAALNVRGQTIHSFFKFPPRIIGQKEIDKAKPNDVCALLDMLVIDEVSMVRADLMDGIDRALRQKRGQLHEPFGGVRVLFVGDLFQLKPIVGNKEAAQWARLNYASAFFFDARVFDRAELHVIGLQRIFRQRDEVFIGLLNRIRHNRLATGDLALLNVRHHPGFEAPQDERWVTLASTNAIADRFNKRKLDSLPTESRTYRGKVEGEFKEKDFPTALNLELKVGAQVMFIRNDVDHHWVNGTFGKVVKLTRKVIKVQIAPDEAPVTVGQETWDAYAYRINRKSRAIDAEVVGTFTQYPLKLAWAMTIHKGQGRTFEKAVIDLGNGAFAHGQTYVALSRCTTLEGIVLRQRMRARDVKVDPAVEAFMAGSMAGE